MGFDQFDAEEAIFGINVTPLVDITLVLLIIFMVTTSYIVNPAIKVDLPKAKNADQTDRSTVSLLLDRKGQLYLNGRRANQEEIKRFIKAECAKNPRLQAVISADRSLQYGRIVWLIDLVKDLGIRRYALNVKYHDGH